MSVLLMAGVSLAGAVTLLGGVLFLSRHWNEPVSYQAFHSQPRVDRIISEILQGAWHGRARSIIQFGILLLIATPVARVVVSLVGFAMERDRVFVVITSIVLGVLVYSLVSGAVTS